MDHCVHQAIFGWMLLLHWKERITSEKQGIAFIFIHQQFLPLFLLCVNTCLMSWHLLIMSIVSEIALLWTSSKEENNDRNWVTLGRLGMAALLLELFHQKYFSMSESLSTDMLVSESDTGSYCYPFFLKIQVPKHNFFKFLNKFTIC